MFYEVLKGNAEKAFIRFPHLFDRRLQKGIERLIANSSDTFFDSRPISHIRRIVLNQFFQQKGIEEKLGEGEPDQRYLLTHLFRSSSQICLSLAFSTSYRFQKEQILKALYTLIPGIEEVSDSYYIWQHPEMPYNFSYLEVQKLRGKDPEPYELREMENTLKELLLVIPPLTSAVFWPYNKEESYRQIQLLKQEMTTPRDLPHISVQFQEQTSTFLEFLIHIARPEEDESLDVTLKNIPFFLFCHFQKTFQSPFPIEVGAFSIQVPSTSFIVRESINLLYARRFLLKHIEMVLGPLRDYNGGLLEKQQEHFETIRLNLSHKIPHFDLFAEKLFYALHSMETWLSLSLEVAESLFTAFSELMLARDTHAIRKKPGQFTILKTAASSDLLNINQFQNGSAHAQISIGGFHYLCLLGSEASHLDPIFKQFSSSPKKTETLRLILSEGSPPSINPHYSSGDMRCKIISKLLFEGLTRLDEEGNPELAGSIEMHQEKWERFTFKLRPFCWSNGEKVTAIDYATAWKTALLDSVNHPEVLYSIKNSKLFKERECSSEELGIEVLDPMTLQIELEKPDPHFLHKLAQPFFFPLFGSYREPKWFNGPYLISENTRKHLVLEKNPYFWDTKSLFYDRIEISWTDDLDAIYSQFIQGETDWIGDPLSVLSPELLARLPDVKTQNVNRRFSLYFHTKHPLLSSSLIRKSLSLSIDRNAICSRIYPHSIPVFPISNESPRELLYEGLKQSGRDLVPLTFSYSQHTRREKLAEYLQETWKEKLGLDVYLEGFDWNHFRNRLEKRQFEICGTIQDTVNEKSQESLSKYEGESSWNFSSWNHPEYATSLRLGNIEKAEKLLSEEVPFAPLFYYTHLYAHTPDLKGFFLDSEGCVDFSRTKRR